MHSFREQLNENKTALLTLLNILTLSSYNEKFWLLTVERMSMRRCEMLQMEHFLCVMHRQRCRIVIHWHWGLLTFSVFKTFLVMSSWADRVMSTLLWHASCKFINKKFYSVKHSSHTFHPNWNIVDCAWSTSDHMQQSYGAKTIPALLCHCLELWLFSLQKEGFGFFYLK